MGRILVALLIGAGAMAATSLAVIRTEDEIVIAADSRVTDLSSGGRQPDTCKVRQTGNAIAAFVGLVSYSSGKASTSFDAVKIVETILAENGRLAAKAEKIKSALGAQLSKLAGPASRALFDQVHGFVLGVVIAGEDREEAVLKLHFVQFSLSPGGALVSSVSFCPGDGCPGGGLRIVAPPADDAGAGGGGAGWASSFVQSQIDRNVPAIGGPLQLVRVTHEGLDWIERPLICAE